MGASNPFEVVLALTAILLIASTALGIIAPSIGAGIVIPEAPEPPVFPSMDVPATYNETEGVFPFNQTLQTFNFDLGTDEYKFTAFSPDKIIKYYASGFEICCFGSQLIVPWWYSEPISYMNGTTITGYMRYEVSIQTIQDNSFNSVSQFIVDKGHPGREAYLTFTPLSGYSDLVSSWNLGHGFTVNMYGKDWEAPDWGTQASAFLTFLGSVIAYVVFFIGYMVTMSGALFQLIGFSMYIAAGVSLLILMVFIGALLMYVRGSSGK